MMKGAWAAGATALLLAMASGQAAFAEDLDTCIQSNETALALRKAARLKDERSALAMCAASSCPLPIRQSCEQRLTQVLSAIPSIIFIAKNGQGADIVNVTLSIDGLVVTDHLTGDPLVVDPGDHEFKFETEGEAAVVKHFVLRQGEQNRREPILIGPPPPPPPMVIVAPPEGGLHLRPRETWAIVSFSAAAAGLAVGAVTGGMAMSKISASNQSCPNDGTMLRCTSAGVSDMNSAISYAHAADVGFSVAAAGIVTGVLLLAIHPSTKETRTTTSGAEPPLWTFGVAPTLGGLQGHIGHAF